MIDIGTVGIWQGLDAYSASELRDVVAELDEQGWPCLWIPEAVSRDPFVTASIVLEATTGMKVATGIASIWARDAMTTANAARTLNEAYDGRFLLGLGVSHHTLTAGLRKHDYSKPYSRMKQYLEQMDASVFKGVEPAEPSSRVLAALGPKMLHLAAEMADGCHPYFVPVEHTASAREAVGPGKIVAVEQMVVLETDPLTARAIARQHMQVYLTLPNYANNLQRFGYSEDEIKQGADRVVDAIVAWGTMDDVIARVTAHQDAGASHVCIQVLQAEKRAENGRRLSTLPREAWSELADALL